MAGEAFGHYADLPPIIQETYDGDWINVAGKSKKGWYIRDGEVYWGRLGRSLRFTQVPWNKTIYQLISDKESKGYVKYTTVGRHASARPDFVCCNSPMMLYRASIWNPKIYKYLEEKSIACRICGRQTQDDPVSALILAMEEDGDGL